MKMAADGVPETAKVVYNYLGKSGLKVANLCLGTMTFGDSGKGLPGQASEAHAHTLMDRYVEWGGNFIDTADVYTGGLSEKYIGSWLNKQTRDDVIIATKVRSGSETPPNTNGLGRRHIIQGLEESLARLQTDYIDLYQMHNWDAATPLEETLRTLDDLIRCGKVRYLGASNLIGWQLQKLVCLTEKLGLNPFVSLQQQYSLVCRETEFEPLQVCKLEGMGVLPWSPLKGGLLTGKYKRSEAPSAGRLAWGNEAPGRITQAVPAWGPIQSDDQVWATIDMVSDIANKHGKSAAQVSLRWLLQKDVVPSVIIGATTVSQLDDNMGAANGWSLSEEEMTSLDEVSQPRIPYPYEMNYRMNKDRCNPFQKSAKVSNVAGFTCTS